MQCERMRSWYFTPSSAAKGSSSLKLCRTSEAPSRKKHRQERKDTSLLARFQDRTDRRHQFLGRFVGLLHDFSVGLGVGELGFLLVELLSLLVLALLLLFLLLLLLLFLLLFLDVLRLQHPFRTARQLGVRLLVRIAAAVAAAREIAIGRHGFRVVVRFIIVRFVAVRVLAIAHF